MKATLGYVQSVDYQTLVQPSLTHPSPHSILRTVSASLMFPNVPWHLHLAKIFRQKTQKAKPSSKLKILNINFQSVVNKVPEFHCLTDTEKPDVVIGCCLISLTTRYFPLVTHRSVWILSIKPLEVAVYLSWFETV